MATGTGVSRLTGLLRVIALAYALGYHHLADAYNLANTTPNMLYDIVLGGVLSATFIPVFVDRLATRSEREAWRAISSIITLSVVVLAVMTALFWVLAPEVISAFTVLGGTSGHAGGLTAEKAVATSLLRWFVPQVALYGLLALAEALLNARRRFAAPMWVPIANNLVSIGVLLWFHALVPNFPSVAKAQVHSGQIVLLGLGTTLGVALQAALLLPHLRGIGLSRLRWRWDPRHEAVATVMRLGSWTFGFVVANQVALYVVLALAVGGPGTDPVSSYTYAYTFMQLPFAVVAVSIMSAVTPELSERWATGDLAEFRRRLAGGLRATLAAILPAAVGMFLLARPAAALLLGHGSTPVTGTEVTGASLAMFALGLPGFCTFLYVIRVLQSMQRPKIAFWLYLLENGVNVILAVALVHPLGVRGLALSLSIAYTVGAVAGLAVLRRWLGTLGGDRTWSPLRRVALASAVMGAVVLVVSNISGAEHGLGLLVRVVGSIVVGGTVYAAAATLLGGRHRGLSLWPELPDGATDRPAHGGPTRRAAPSGRRDGAGLGTGEVDRGGPPRGTGAGTVRVGGTSSPDPTRSPGGTPSPGGTVR
ncbi:MAG: murein biosynthesis integral membrane protein MurJ, partial [Acidimicrobiales bacterium]